MKLNKIKVALFAAGVLLSGHAIAVDSVAGTEGTIYSTFVNDDDEGNSVSTVNVVTGATTARIYEDEAATATPTSTAVKTLTPDATASGRTCIANCSGPSSGKVYSYAAESYSPGSNTNNVAFGTRAVAGYGIQENPDFEANTGNGYQYYGGGSSTAIGVDSLALIGGTAIGNESVATGKDSVAIGKEAVASGYKSITIGEDSTSVGAFTTVVGNDAHATGDEAVALGADAEAEGDNSVALGAGSVADRDNNVSVGSAGNERTISNVAPGVYGTDAVNVNQLKAVERKISAGVSAAMAMTTPVIAPGKSNAVALGAASYNNTSAVALNLAHKFTDDVVATASVSKGFNSGRTSSGSNDDIGIKGSVSWSF
jgi:hypothetical protein